MYDEMSRVFYIDVFDGVVKESVIIEKDKDGLWIKVKGSSTNTFVYSDILDQRIFEQKDEAVAALDRLRTAMKARLLPGSLYIQDICKKLEHNEGKLYTGVIREILQGK